MTAHTIRECSTVETSTVTPQTNDGREHYLQLHRGLPIEKADHLIGALREKICKKRLEREPTLQRPSREEWHRDIAELPLSERERAWIGKYDRILNEQRVAVTHGAPRWHHSSRKQSLSPLNAQCRAATRSPPCPVERLSARSHSLGRGETQSP